MTANQREALRLLGIYSAGRFDIWALAGSHKASCRAHVMSQLLGQKTPQSKSGVNAIRDAFYGVAGDAITGDCIALREDSFVEWAVRQVGTEEERITYYGRQGCTTSDAQGIVQAQDGI